MGLFLFSSLTLRPKRRNIKTSPQRKGRSE
nr:MAG TPA: hypothetical protein [Caudoviricetes sp.]